MDEEVVPADIPKQWQEARDNRRMQFKVRNYRDSSGESNIRLLTGTNEADWIQLPVEQYLAALPPLKQEVIWGIQAGRCCPLEDYQRGEVATLSLSSQWTVFGGLLCRSLCFRTVWLEVSMMGWSSSQGCWLWLSRLEEKVWVPCAAILTHNGDSYRTNLWQGTWLVFSCWTQREALHK